MSRERYANPTKRDWRNWAWNRVAERAPAKSLALVLCGQSGEDLECAKRHDWKVIGVDRDAECVKGWRAKGGVAIQDDILNQAICLHPQALFLDVMGGFTRASFFRLKDLYLFSPVVVWNFLRGRDAGIDGFYRDSERKQPFGFCPVWNRQSDCIDLEEYHHHRGMMFWSWYIGNEWAKLESVLSWYQEPGERALIGEFKNSGHPVPLMHTNLDGKFEPILVPWRFICALAWKARPEFFSYLSEDSISNYYDSIVFSALTTPSSAAKESKGVLVKMGGNALPLVRKAAAAKAVLTMKGRR
jgi:hypothetical protein